MRLLLTTIFFARNGLDGLGNGLVQNVVLVRVDQENMGPVLIYSLCNTWSAKTYIPIPGS